MPYSVGFSLGGANLAFMRRLRLTGLGCALPLLLGYAAPQGDSRPLHDPMRPVMEIGRDYVVLQYYTRTPCVV